MAEEAGTTQEAAPAAAEQKPALKYSQADLDNITEKVRQSTEAKIKADLEQQRKDAELSEVEKLRKQLADEAAARADVASKLTRRERMDAVKEVAGNVPNLYVQAAMDAAGDAEFDAEKVATRARELFDKQMADAGYVPKGTAAPKMPEKARGGTPAITGTTDFSGMTSMQYRSQLLQLRGPDQAKFRNDAAQFARDGGKFIDE